MEFFNIKDKNILITGASSGLGKEIAKFLSLESYNVRNNNLYIVGRDKEKLNSTKVFLKCLEPRNVTSFCVDLKNSNEIEKLVKELPPLDGVIFSAGVAEYSPVKSLNDKKIYDIFQINFNSQVILTQQLIKQKKLKEHSSLIYISSVASKLGTPGTSIYSASKSALNSFVKVTASELAKSNIRANIISPGLITTPMGQKALKISDKDLRKDYPLGVGIPSDILGPVIFFLSNYSRWVTGSELIVDGGLTLK